MKALIIIPVMMFILIMASSSIWINSVDLIEVDGWTRNQSRNISITTNYYQVNLSMILNETEHRINNDSLIMSLIPGAGLPYLFIQSNNIYLNESKLNDTIKNISIIQKKRHDFQVSVVGGNGNSISTYPLNFIVTSAIVTPTTDTNNYRFELYEQATGNIIDRDRISHNGTWNIEKNHAIDDYVIANISASIDETFNISIEYLYNGWQVIP